MGVHADATPRDDEGDGLVIRRVGRVFRAIITLLDVLDFVVVGGFLVLAVIAAIVHLVRGG